MAKSKEEAQQEVPDYVEPGSCFITYIGTKAGYSTISGTPCAHFVSHRLEIKKRHAGCDLGYEVRVRDLLLSLKEISVTEVQVGDVWARLKGSGTGAHKEPSDHCGLVAAVENKGGKMTIAIQHDSSGQRLLATNDWADYFHSGGKFYRPQRSVEPPKAALNRARAAGGLPTA